MRRVVAVTKGLGTGGSERLLVEFARNAQDVGVEFSVVSILDQKRQLIPELERAGSRVTCVGVTALRDVRWMPRLVRAIREQRPDVVHIHSPALSAFVRCAAHVRLLGLRRPRVVTTEHNAWSTFHPLTRWSNALTTPLDDATVAVSAEVHRSIRPGRLARRLTTILHGIDLASTQSAAAERERLRGEWGVGPGEIVVATVANYRPQKNYPNLLRAAAIAAEQMPHLRFVVVGQGPGADDVHRLHAELGLGGRMLLLGYRPDAIAVIAAADIFALASDYEGLPVSLMEALALGRAVVATSVGGVAESVTDDAGRLVPPGDHAALASALVEVASDPALLARLQRGARGLSESFDVRKSAAALGHVYRNLDRSRPTSSR
jgi:glycosyltransferase involved in cell wall biosynthesis